MMSVRWSQVLPFGGRRGKQRFSNGTMSTVSSVSEILSRTSSLDGGMGSTGSYQVSEMGESPFSDPKPAYLAGQKAY